MRSPDLILACLLLAGPGLRAYADPLPAKLPTPAAILAAAPAADWGPVDPANLLVIDLRGGARVVVELADAFAPVHASNIRKLAREHWYDGLSVERVQDDYVTQWGDPEGTKPLPRDVVRAPPPEYERSAAGLHPRLLPFRDTYAPAVGVVSAFPVAEDGGRAWLTHCYGMVGVGRDLNPDTGTGAELYVVIGQPPRWLDRNIALVGRVVSGVEALSSLPRGTGKLGFYTAPAQRTPIRQVRLGSDMPADDQPNLQQLRPENATYGLWVQAEANRQNSFFLHPAGALDVCNALPPVQARAP